MSGTDLTEKQWRQLEPHLPSNPRYGPCLCPAPACDQWHPVALANRASWRDIPLRHGPWSTRYDRFVRWSLNGAWQRLLKVMQAAAENAGLVDWDGAALDATHIKAQRSAVGARRPASCRKEAVTDERLGRSRGGITSKIHLCVDGHGLPLSIPITAGQCRHAATVGRYWTRFVCHGPIEVGHGNVLLACVSTALTTPAIIGNRFKPAASGAFALNVLMHKSRLRNGPRGDGPPRFDAEAYKGRNVVEHVINRPKDFRAVATGYKKHGHNYLVAVTIATIILWLI